MQAEVIMAGFGGQGIMLIGKILAYAGMEEGKEVSWLPSYGPEMRGGTANCTVVLSDQPIGSPVVDSPSGLIVMNRPSLERFAAFIKPNGILIINQSLIDVSSSRNDIDVSYVPCNDIAMECGTGKAANMVALGAYIGRTNIVKLETVYNQIQNQFSKNPKLVSLNKQALKRGYDLTKKEETSV